MYKKNWGNKSCMIVALCAIVVLSAAPAFAAQRHHDRRARAHQKGIFSFALALFLPSQRVVMSAGPGYYNNVIVRKPIVVQPQPYHAESIIINVPNIYGGYTAVRLVRHSQGYLGPQGEYYFDYPTVYQLAALYGR